MTDGTTAVTKATIEERYIHHRLYAFEVFAHPGLGSVEVSCDKPAECLAEPVRQTRYVSEWTDS